MTDNWGIPPDPHFETMGAERVLEFIRDTARRQARLEAQRLAAIERFARLRPGDDRVADLLALGLTVTIARADRDLSLAYVLHERLPNTLAALRRGDLDRARVDTIDHATRVLSDPQALAVDARLFPKALELKPGQLTRFVRRLVLDADPAGATVQAEVRRHERQVSVEHDVGGMSWLTAYLPSEAALACWNRINRLANAALDADRTIDQVRADVVRDQLLGTVAAEAPSGLAERVRGHGQVPADRGRELAELIRLRDRTCTHPGCNRAAEHADIDHVIPVQRGAPTDRHRGQRLCRKHQRLTQNPLWTVTRAPGSVSDWRTRVGHVIRTYANHPNRSRHRGSEVPARSDGPTMA